MTNPIQTSENCWRHTDQHGNFYRKTSDPKSELHREDGPAIEWASGDKEWFMNGKCHREDGPAIEYANGYKYWYINNKLHREDGPAIERANGDKLWYINGKRHREDGPAIEYTSGSKYWYYHDQYINVNSKEEFERYLKEHE